MARVLIRESARRRIKLIKRQALAIATAPPPALAPGVVEEEQTVEQVKIPFIKIDS